MLSHFTTHVWGLWDHISRLFCSCNLNIDPMTIIYELDPYLLKIYVHTRNELLAGLSKFVVLLAHAQIEATRSITTSLSRR